ncbi:MAG TPA: hypothetical protein VGF02_12830 [Pseudolabrys sp.]|jgi:hypothetical protein
MPDIIQEAWRSVDECALLAQETDNREMRRFFLNLARSWKKVALNYEILAQNDHYLAELKRSRETDYVGYPTERQRRTHDPARAKRPARFAIGLFWRRA